MSTTHRSALVGLVSPGLIWVAAAATHGQDARPQGLPPIPAPASASPTYAVLLMSNGTVIRGEIRDDPAGGVYRLKTRGGMVPYPRTSVRRAGQTIDELYRYQVAALPVGDPEERMKLVRWCLTEHLAAEAREQLADVLRICPDDPEALRMAANLDATAENGGRDGAVQRTSGEMPAADGTAPPGDLPPGITRKLRTGFNNNLPEIFDLPPAIAVRRASEFAEVVQVVLQKNCTGCHNEKYQGSFQLVEVRNNKDLRNPDIARANLDAALRLVNPDDPGRSDLLSAGLVPHGPTKNPIFRGANDPQYQKLNRWVRSLRPPAAPGTGGGAIGGNRFGGASGDSVTPAGYNPGAAGGFGADRSGRAAPSTTSGDDAPGGRLPGFTPQGRTTVNDYNESADFSGGRAVDFTPPYSIGGTEFDRKFPGSTTGPAVAASNRRPGARSNPAAGGAGSAPTPPRTAPPPITPADEPAETGPAVTPTTGVEIAPGRVAIGPDTDPNKLPGMNQPLYPTKPKATAADDDAPVAGARTDPAAKSPPAARKKPKIDPADLEKLMRSRAGGS